MLPLTDRYDSRTQGFSRVIAVPVASASLSGGNVLGVSSHSGSGINGSARGNRLQPFVCRRSTDLVSILT